jgi:hypothetical protein
MTHTIDEEDDRWVVTAAAWRVPEQTSKPSNAAPSELNRCTYSYLVQLDTVWIYTRLTGLLVTMNANAISTLQRTFSGQQISYV